MSMTTKARATEKHQEVKRRSEERQTESEDLERTRFKPGTKSSGISKPHDIRMTTMVSHGGTEVAGMGIKIKTSPNQVQSDDQAQALQENDMEDMFGQILEEGEEEEVDRASSGMRNGTGYNKRPSSKQSVVRESAGPKSPSESFSDGNSSMANPFQSAPPSSRSTWVR